MLATSFHLIWTAVGADILLTWNVRDFTRLGSAIALLVKTPLEL